MKRQLFIAGALLYLLAALSPSAASAQSPMPPPLKPGFPVTLAGGGIMESGHPTVADLGLTPGHKSIAFCTTAKKLFVINYDGTVASGFPQTLPGRCKGTVAIGDINGDGFNEIVVPYGSFSPVSPGGVAAYDRHGTQLWNRPSGDFDGDGVADAVVGAPAIADVDNDGEVEVAWGSLDAHIYLVDGRNGNDKPGWPKFVRDTVFSSPALFDLEGNGKVDVIIGADAHMEGPPFNTPDGGCLHALHPDATEVAGFPHCIDQVITSSPAIGDINGDGKPEIVVGTGRFYSGRAHQIYAFEPDGTQAPGWPVAVDGESETSPALADIDGDGNPEVIVTDNNDPPSTIPHVYAFKGNGTRLWKTVPKSFFGTTPDAADPVIADVAGDGHLEILVAVNSEIAVLDASGHQLTDDGTHFAGSFSYYTEFAVRAAAVTDWESDNLLVEVATVSALGTSDTSDTKVYVWNPKPPTTYPWGTFHQNPQHTGVVPGTGSRGPTHFYTLFPCRAVDTRNANGPYGGPALAAQSIRAFALGGQCGVPAGAVAVSANVTIVTPSSDGYLTAYPGTGAPPQTSLIDYSTGRVLANSAVLPLLAGQGSFQLNQPAGTAHLLVDVNGYFQ
jgi:hypothetical protein